jgi:hypothetical protein
MTAFTGGCLCGGVRYEVAPPTLFFSHCHCDWCRRAHGAAFVTWVGAAEERFLLTAGAGSLRWYASSAHSRRGFCTNCGTTLFFASALCPGEVHVTRASFDGAVDREPQLHCFWDQRVDWAAVADELPRIDSMHEGLANYRAVPPRG